MILTIALGLAIGLIMGITGAGGGILAVPLLVYFLNLDITDATPIGLIAVAIAAIIGAALGFRHRLVRYRAAVLMAVIGMLLAPLGIWISTILNNRILLMASSLVLLYVAYKTGSDRQYTSTTAEEAFTLYPCKLNSNTGRLIWTSRCSLAMLFSGAIAGFLSGLIGVGGGFVIIPALKKFTNLSPQSAVATSLAVIALVSSTVVLSHMMVGSLDWSIATPFTLGAASGMLAGGMIQSNIHAKWIHTGFAGVTLLAVLMLISKAI